MPGEASAADDHKELTLACITGFVNQGHASPVMAEQACGCLFQQLPPEVASKAAAAVVSPDKGVAAGYGEAFARLIAQCRAKSCADPKSTDESCDFDLAHGAEDGGDHLAAIEHYSRFISAHPDLPAAISNRGRIYIEIGAYDLAIADLKKAVAMMGSGDSSDLYLAHAYHLAGRDKDAASIIDEAAKANWSTPYASLFRAEIREAQGRRDDAIADYRDALEHSAGTKDIAPEALASLKRLGAD